MDGGSSEAKPGGKPQEILVTLHDKGLPAECSAHNQLADAAGRYIRFDESSVFETP